MTDAAADLKTTPLHALHRELGGKMVPFAGYDMPVQYPMGILKEHLHVREKAGLFDVSHMGQVRIDGPNVAAAFEKLAPSDIQILKPGRTRYTLFTEETGGILDDLMVTNAGGWLYVVVNAACKEQDLAHMRRKLAGAAEVTELADRALMALQGPMAAEALGRLDAEAPTMKFMSFRETTLDGVPAFVTRSGYTGEDGFEISVPAADAEKLARRLLAEPEVAPIGLGARDSLRLEAGLCLYGHDIDAGTTPIEADLGWVVSKRRREEGGYPGADVVARQLETPPERLRVGIRPEGRAPVREGAAILDANGASIGVVTSGGFGPTVGGPVAMGYVARGHAAPGSEIFLDLRGKAQPARVVELPFTPHRYYRG